MNLPRPILAALLPLFVFFSCSSDSEDPTSEPDTIAPTVSFTISGTSGSGPIVVSDQMEININAQDAGGVAKVEAFIDDQKVGEDTTTPYSIIVDLSGYATKSFTAKSLNYTLRVDATDTSGNTSSTQQAITIESKTQLITVYFPEQNNNPELVDFYLFASSMTGELLGIEKLEPGQDMVAIRTTVDIGEDEEYMLTFAQRFTAHNGETNQLATIQNIKASIINEIRIKNHPNFPSNFSDVVENEYPVEGFWDENTIETIAIDAQGFDYGIGGNNCSCNQVGSNGNITLHQYNELNNLFATDKVYFKWVNADQNTAQYAFLDKTLFQDGFKLIPELFSSEGMSLEKFGYPSLKSELSGYPRLRVYAFEDDQDYNNNVFHTGYPYLTKEDIETDFYYWLDNNFTYYLSELIYLKYKVDHTGTPYATYNGIDWTLSHTFQNDVFTIEKNTSNQDFVGRIGISDFFSSKEFGQQAVLDGGEYETYRWNIIFDSRNNTTVVIPTIPEELQEWIFNGKYNNQTFGSAENIDQRQVEVIRYENLNSYDEYLQKVIQNNEKWYMVSPSRESIFDNPSIWNENYFYPNHFLFD